jgi:hypothetical protein
VLHAPVQALLQQKPSTQAPFAQSALPPAQAWPTTSLHAPVPSQVLVPVQLGGSGALSTGAHVPALAAVLHAAQVLQLPVSQQTPSVQKPVSHWLPAVHALPCA